MFCATLKTAPLSVKVSTHIPGVLTEQRVVKENFREGPGVPHPPHGRAHQRQAPGDLLLLERQEAVLVNVDGQVT